MGAEAPAAKRKRKEHVTQESPFGPSRLSMQRNSVSREINKAKITVAKKTCRLIAQKKRSSSQVQNVIKYGIFQT